MKAFIFDASVCNGCYNCQLVCKDEHVENEWLPYAAAQPDTGQFWMRMKEQTHGQVPKVKVEYTAVPCMHCANPACLKASQNGAVYQREDGLVIIDPIKAKGQKQIVEACPYNAAFWNEELQLPQKCTGCAHLLDEGREPRCVESCPTGALRFGEEEDFSDEIQGAETRWPELGLKPRVYYLNGLKTFIAGDVFDPVSDECLKDAKITLLNEKTGQSWEETSDDFGDFWFREREPGLYSLKIEKDNYISYQKQGIQVAKSINLGEFPLIRRS